MKKTYAKPALEKSARLQRIAATLPTSGQLD
jgi:hypothetical protein